MRKLSIPVMALALSLVAALAGAQSPAPTLSRTAHKPSIDGVISAGEYSTTIDLGAASLALSLDAETLFIGLMGQTTGWLGVGISPQGTMNGATIFIGVVASGGDPKVLVERGTGFSHAAAKSAALASYAVKESGQSTTMELAVKAAEFIAGGQRVLGLIVALGPGKDSSAYHGGARTPVVVNLAL